MSAPLTVACVFVQGEYPYTPEYVVCLHAMVARWIDRPFRFVCFTDQPWMFGAGAVERPGPGQPIIETVPITKLAGFAPWTKLELFNPARQWAGRLLYLDLDSLIVAPLAPIIDYPAPFAITADPPRAGQKQVDAFGRQIVRRFNSSVMAWDGGTHTELFAAWTSAVSQRLSGDQDWIGERLPLAATLPRAWFPRISELQGQPPKAPAKVVLCKVPKNAIASDQWPWFESLWRAA